MFYIPENKYSSAFIGFLQYN